MKELECCVVFIELFAVDGVGQGRSEEEGKSKQQGKWQQRQARQAKWEGKGRQAKWEEL